MSDYFDYAASTPVSPAALKSMAAWQAENFANPSASHHDAKKAFEAIQNARESVAEKIGAMPSEIIFTSGASESNNLAIKGVAFKELIREGCKGHFVTSSIEHKCVLNTFSFLESLGFEVTYVKPDDRGIVSVKSVFRAVRENTKLISVHHVNNELGCIQPTSEIGRKAFDAGILFHTDAAQSFCKIAIDVDEMNVDFLSLSGHKIFAPKGIGALYIRDARESGLVPLIHGGGQEFGLRGGTSPTPLIVGLAAAVSDFPCEPSAAQAEFESVMRHYNFIRNGGDHVVPTIWNVTFDCDEELKRFMEERRWLISQGSACNAMTHVASHVLTSIGLSEREARRTFRISLPPFASKAFRQLA